MGSLQKTHHIVRYAVVEAGIHRYRVGTETLGLRATSRGGTSPASSFLADLFCVGRLPFPATFATELAVNFEAGASSFDREFALHLRQAGHHLKEEAS